MKTSIKESASYSEEKFPALYTLPFGAILLATGRNRDTSLMGVLLTDSMLNKAGFYSNDWEGSAKRLSHGSEVILTQE